MFYNIQIIESNNVFRIKSNLIDIEFTHCYEYSYDNKYDNILLTNDTLTNFHHFDYAFKKDRTLVAKLVYNLDGYYILIKANPMITLNTDGEVIIKSSEEKICSSIMYTIEFIDYLLSKLYELQLINILYPWNV